VGDIVQLHVRKPAPKRPKRRGLAIAFGAGEGFVYISASGRQKMSLREISQLIRDLRDVRDAAKARVKV
jgi:hypothetical protein